MPAKILRLTMLCFLLIFSVFSVGSCRQTLHGDADSVASAINRTLSFLQSNILESGEFPSRYCIEDGRFLSCSVDHSTFPTTFVVDALAGMDDPTATLLLSRAANYLESIRENGDLWRYWQSGWRGRNMPYDLDDTSCARAALIKSGRMESFDDIGAFEGNRQPDGSISAWVGVEQLDIDCAANANMLYYLSLEHRVPQGLPEFIERNLPLEKAKACNIWYKTSLSFYYFTARAIRANPALQNLSAGVIAEVEKLRRPDASFASALETVLGAATLFTLKENLNAEDEKTLVRLLSMQRSDGSFPAEPFYIERPGTFFESEALSSAFALDALNSWQKRNAAKASN